MSQFLTKQEEQGYSGWDGPWSADLEKGKWVRVLAQHGPHTHQEQIPEAGGGTWIKPKVLLSLVAYTFNPSIQEVEAGISLSSKLATAT